MTFSPRQAPFSITSTRPVVLIIDFTDELLLQLQPLGEGVQVAPLT